MNGSGANNHIPHIIHIFPSFGRGGVPIKICTAINHFANAAKHSIISTNDDYGSQSILDDDLDVTVLKLEGINDGSLFSRLKKYRHFLKNSHADLLITYNWGSVEWALANSFGPIMRHIHVESGFGPDEATATLMHRNLFRRFAIRNIDFLSIPSHTLKTIAQTKWKVAADKIKYIPNGVDIEKYSTCKTISNIEGFNKQDDETIIGTIAPLRPEKNLSRLINAFDQAILQKPTLKMRLMIIGEGVERPKLEALSVKLNLSDKIIFTGYVATPEKVIGLFDIFAISSDTEQMPNALNEAMAASLPIVGLSVGDVKHMVSAENKKYIVSAGDDSALIEAITTLSNDKEQQKMIGAANLNHVKKLYDRKDMYLKYAELWGI